jgi:trigger factor
VQKRYQKEIEDETQRTLVQHAFREAVQAKNLDILSAPEMEDINFKPGLSLSFSTVVELPPQFSLPEYKNIPVKKASEEVDEAEIIKTLDTLREQRASFVDVIEPRPLAMDDFAVINYLAFHEGKPLRDIVPDNPSLGENKNFWLWMKPETFVPGFVEQALGMKVGDRREITVQLPEKFNPEALAGKKITFQVELQQIKVRQLPELNDAFTQEVARLDLEELKKRLRENLAEEKKLEARREQSRQIVDYLLDKVDFDLPENVVADATSQTIYDIVAENQARGIPQAMLEEKKQEIFTNAAKSARQSVKLKLIARKIAEAEKIEVSNDDVAHRITLMAAQQQMPPDKLVAQLHKNGSIPDIRERIMLQKVMDFLLQNAKVE